MIMVVVVVVVVGVERQWNADMYVGRGGFGKAMREEKKKKREKLWE